MYCCLYLNIEDLNIFMVYENYMFMIIELIFNKIWGLIYIYIYVIEILILKDFSI